MNQHNGSQRNGNQPNGKQPNGTTAGQYEYLVLSLPRSTSRSDARRLLTEHAEYGHWELARVRLYLGGGRRVWLRRRIIKVARTA